MASEPEWLTDQEQTVWRTWVDVNARLMAALAKRMHHDAALSLQDFEVLVHLTDQPDGKARISELADMLQWDRSRLSHHLKRMERSELVTRELCLEDGRGSYVVVTDAGRDAIDRAAPPHVDAVRTLFFDVLTTEEALELGRLGRKVLDRVNAERS